MAKRQASFYCPQCKQPRLFTSTDGINHVLHLLISVFLCGIWLPFWILMAMSDKPRFYCSQCGYSDATEYLGNPLKRRNEQIAAERRQAARAQTKQEFLAALQTSRPYLWAANPVNTWKVAVGTAAGFVVGVLLIFTFVDFSKSSSPPVQVVTKPTPTAQPISATYLMKAKMLLTKSPPNKEEKAEAVKYLKAIQKTDVEYTEAQEILKKIK